MRTRKIKKKKMLFYWLKQIRMLVPCTKMRKTEENAGNAFLFVLMR